MRGFTIKGRNVWLWGLRATGLGVALLLVTAVEAGTITVPVTAFWDFDGANPLTDQTGNGHNLIDPGGGSSPTYVRPAPVGPNGWTPDGLVGRAARFDGGDYFSIPNDVYTGGDFTFLIAQRQSNPTDAFRTILASSRFRYQNVNNTLQGAINAPGGSFGGSSPLNINDWYLIALRYTHATRALESFAVTNTGALGSPVLTGSATAPGLNNATNFRIGGDGTSLIGGFDGWSGELDFAVFHNGALSNGQIQSIVTQFNSSPLLVPQPAATAVWDFNGPNPLADRTGHGHDLINPGGSASPAFVTPSPSANGWRPMALDGGTAARFDGVDDYLSIPNSVYQGGDFTVIVAHRRPASASGHDTILASSRFRYQDVNNTLQGAINAPGGGFGTAVPLTPDDWYFTALRYDNITRQLDSFTVTNSDLLGPIDLTGFATAPGIGNATNWRIGGDGTSLIGGFDGWAGEIDFVMFYNQFLTAGQLQAVFNNFVVPEPSTFGLFGAGAAVLLLFRRRRG